MASACTGFGTISRWSRGPHRHQPHADPQFRLEDWHSAFELWPPNRQRRDQGGLRLFADSAFVTRSMSVPAARRNLISAVASAEQRSAEQERNVFIRARRQEGAITGGSAGIRRRPRRGHGTGRRVVGICARRSRSLEDVARACREHGGSPRLGLDLTRLDEPRGSSGRPRRSSGAIDMLVNQCGIPKRRAIAPSHHGRG